MSTESLLEPFYGMVLPAVLVWSDILGFTDRIKESDLHALEEITKELRDAITTAQEHFQDKATDEWQIAQAWARKTFTDNLVFGYPIVNSNGFELSHAIYMTAHYQMQMALSNFFVRGAIAINGTYLDEDIVIGKALIEAYEDETKIAKVPRIMLSKTARNHILSHTDTRNSPLLEQTQKDLLVDADGNFFINYLEVVSNTLKDKGCPEKIINKIAIHKSKVTKNLVTYSNNPYIYSKYQWVANYHNYFCSQHPEIPAELQIEVLFENTGNFQQLNYGYFTDFSPLSTGAMI